MAKLDFIVRTYSLTQFEIDIIEGYAHQLKRDSESPNSSFSLRKIIREWQAHTDFQLPVADPAEPEPIAA